MSNVCTQTTTARALCPGREVMVWMKLRAVWVRACDCRFHLRNGPIGAAGCSHGYSKSTLRLAQPAEGVPQTYIAPAGAQEVCDEPGPNVSERIIGGA